MKSMVYFILLPLVLVLHCAVTDPVSKNIERLTKGTREEKMHAIFELDRLNDTRGVGALCNALRDPDPEIRAAASGRLIFLHDGSAFEPLAAALDDDDSLVRRHAAYALERLGDVRAVPYLREALKDPVMEVRYDAVIALGALGGTAAVNVLISALDDVSPPVMNEAIKGLCMIGEERAIPRIMKAILRIEWKQVNPWFRSEAFRGCKKNMTGKAAVPLLRFLLRDFDDKGKPTVVARDAAVTLAMVHDDRSGIQVLRTALRQDHFSQQEAALALAHLKDDTVIPDLVRIMRSAGRQINRRVAFDALVAIGGPKVKAALAAFTDHRDPHIGHGSRKVLGLPLSKEAAAEAVYDKNGSRSVPEGTGISKVDLSARCNATADMVLDSEPADRGGNKGPDLSMDGLPAGEVGLRGIPFVISQKGAGRKAAFIAVSGDEKRNLPGLLDLPVNGYGTAVYFLHTVVGSEYGTSVGRYRVTYHDGTVADIPLVAGKNIADWTHDRDSDQCLTGWLGYHAATGRHKNLAIYEWKNPYPDKRIGSIRMEGSPGPEAVVLAAITLGNRQPFFSEVTRDIRKGLTGQIRLREPVVYFRNGESRLTAQVTDENGTAVSGADVLARVYGRTFTLKEGSPGEYALVMKKPEERSERVSSIIVSASKGDEHYPDVQGLVHNFGYPRLFSPPHAGIVPQFIVLGVDDIRNPEGSQILLDMVESLRNKGAHAVFSLWVTSGLDGKGYPESLERCRMMWQRFYGLGCEICNHSMNHNLNGINWFAMPDRARQRREVEGHAHWLRENIHGLDHIYNFKGGGGGRGEPVDWEFSRQLIASQNYEYTSSRVGHPREQAWPYRLGDQWMIERAALDHDAPPVRDDIRYKVYGDNPGNFHFSSLEEGIAFWTANFEYRYAMKNRPPLVVSAFHDWGMKDLDLQTFRYQAAALKGFLEKVLVAEREKYPHTYVITFHQLVKYMKSNDLLSILAEGAGQDREESGRDYPDFN